MTVQVEVQHAEQELEKALFASVPSMGTVLLSAPVKIMVDICISNGMRIQQRYLSYEGLKTLVGKLEGLC